MFCSRLSAVPSQRFLPQLCVQSSSASAESQVGMWAVGHVSDRHFVFRPTREQWQKQVPAYLSVQSANTVHGPTSADCQIRHVERLRYVSRVLAAKGQ